MTPNLFGDDRGEADEQRALVALSMVPGVGPGRLRALVARFGSAAAVLTASKRALAEVDGVGAQTARSVVEFDADGAVEEQFATAERVAATLLPLWNDDVPPLLREIYDPPAFLWMRGRLTAADRRAIAIVGTRRASSYGRRVAGQLAAELAERGYTIVSGLAYGIDKAAHEGALEAGGRTLAVLGSGVDRIYPSRHTSLAERIVNHGAVLSEFPLGTAPDAVNFPRRNRIVSGLCLGTVVVEAREKGGALITARLAVEQNREVFAVPSSLHNASGVGANRLIQRGHAKLVTGVDDILEEIEGPSVQPASGGDEAEVQPSEHLDLNDIERRLYEALSAEPTHVDTLCVEADVDPSSALVYLLSLEFKGLVRQMAGRQFYRV